MKLQIKKHTNYYLPQEKLLELLKEAGIEKVDYIIPYNAHFYNYVYKVRANNGYYLLKVQKEDNKKLELETNKMQNDIDAFKMIKKETDNRIPDIVYTNADYIEKKVEHPELIFTVYKYSLATPYGELKPNGNEKKALYFYSGEVVGDFSHIKTKTFGSPSVGFANSWSGALKKMIVSLKNDEFKYCHKISKETKLLEQYYENNLLILNKVTPTFVHFNITPDYLYYLNKNEDLIVTNPGEYFYGDFLADLLMIQPLTKLENKVYFIQGYNNTAHNVLEIDDEVKIRYYMLMLYKALVMKVKIRIRYKWFDPLKEKQSLISKAMIKMALSELKNLCPLMNDKEKTEKEEEKEEEIKND